MTELLTTLRTIFRDVVLFCEAASGLSLRNYQQEVAQAIVESVICEEGLTFVVIFPRQSGKNELQAQIECYLLTMLQQIDAEMVKVSPTWKPQSLNAMRRLERVMARNLVCKNRWSKERGYIYRVGSARIFFLSGARSSSVVGATASTLLQCDEAQDVSVAKWDKDFAPMAASTNATRVFWGTSWTNRTLLARELRAAQEAEKKDGIKRVFHIGAAEVGEEVESYARYVAEQVQKLGRNHPLVRTQYFSEEINAEGGMFPAERRALMQGDHSRLLEPRPGKIYAFLIDVAGEDEGAADVISDLDKNKLRNPARDATALTIVEVDLSSLSDEVLRAPTYRVVNRKLWLGVSHTQILGEVVMLADFWGARYVVVDATGVGAGLTSFLERALPGKVLPYIFSPKSKSELGWGFLAVCDTGRFKDHAAIATQSLIGGRASQATRQDRGVCLGAPERSIFWLELENVEYEALDNRMLRWSVPDGTRDIASGELIHDDLVLSAALCAVLDEQEWSIGGPPLVIRGRDPLEDLDREFR